jgi:hypothetical protein
MQFRQEGDDRSANCARDGNERHSPPVTAETQNRRWPFLRGRATISSRRPLSEANVHQPIGPFPAPSTVCVRRLRARRKQGFVCVTAQMHRAQIGTLVYEGILPDEQRSDMKAIERALQAFLNNSLMPKTPWLIELRSR